MHLSVSSFAGHYSYSFIIKTLMRKASLLLLLAAALGSCKKDNETTPTASASKADLLVAKSWRISAETSTYTVTGSTPIITNEYAGAATCERDDFLKFNANKTAVFDEGATKCNTSDPQTQNGTWDLTTNDTKLSLLDPSQGSIAFPFDVITLSANTLQLRYSYSYSSGGISATQTRDVTFTAF